MATDKALEDLDLTKDEVKRLGEALKDEKFRKMLVEYAEEISDPENRRKAEEEIRMMENERGMDVQFIHPKPGHVLKTTVDGTTKAFINICQNDKVDKPSSKKEQGTNGKYGLLWHIPHSFAPPRDDLDKAKGKCRVFDVVFHPDTYRMASNNNRFLKLVEDTAIEGIERQFSVVLDKKNLKRPKMTFKGQPVATVIRNRTSDANVKQDSDHILDKMPYPYDTKTSTEKAALHEEKRSASANGKNSSHLQKEEQNFTIPKYSIIHRSNLDLSEYRNAPDAKTSTRPTELVIKIDLPLLKSAAELDLDIFERKIVIESTVPAAYKLDLNLPFPVNDDEGSAKFDKSKRTLTVTLPVIQAKVPTMPFSHKGDGDHTENGLDDPDDVPTSNLISVIQDAPMENGLKDSTDLIEQNDSQKHDKGSEASEVNGKVKLSSKEVKWLLPEYRVSQDSETISFVIRVSSVQEKSVSMTFKENFGVRIEFMSVGSGCFPSYYALSMDFGEDCRISPTHCNVDVSDDNLVLLLLKDKSCRELWDSYSIGLDKDSLEVKQFLTESNLKRDLCSLDEECEKEASMPVQKDNDVLDLSVLEMYADKLTIEIKPKGKSEDEEEILSDLSSPASIEVVHRNPTPPLHSILKQRTVSDSSEDHSLAASTANIDLLEDEQFSRSISEEDTACSSRRRTVSFNSRIDQASFKSNASVSSMAPALKSKRKKQRKREVKVKKAERRRRKLSGENTSSGDENLSRESLSDSHSVSECEEEDGEEKGTFFERSISDPGPDRDLSQGTDLLETDSQSHGKLKDSSAECSDVISNDSDVLDVRTSKCNDNSKMSGVEVKSPVENDKSALSWNEKVTKEITTKLSAGKSCMNETEEGDDSDDDDGAVVEGGEEVLVQGGMKKEDESERSKNEDKSEVETMLSWEDGPAVSGTDHVTQCSFQFSNTVMFDLDDD